MTTTIDLSGKVALVTGSSRGIGRSIAERLASSGADIVINGTTESDSLNQVAADIASRHGVTCKAVAADVAQRAAVEKMFQTTFSTYRRLDILVNNAGILVDGLIGMIRENDLNATMQINAIGAINCIQCGTRLLARSNGASIINIASIIGVRGNIGQLAYSASKGAVIAATLSAAKELASRQIRVNAIAPGYIQTDMIKNIPPEIHKKREASIAMGRIGTPEDIADVALFLASNLSRYVTGTVIGVDGGMLI